MQKQYVISLEPPHSPIADCEESCIAVYLADEVDAYRAETGATIHALQAGIEHRDTRIAELETALKAAVDDMRSHSILGKTHPALTALGLSS